ncbi:MAG: transcriptional activator RfaH [Verrucomicrobiota bacterium]|nr:transcriptional activator RfaH [Verrucomicrobiota bacterium]
MTYSFEHLATVNDPLWFCLKAQPKREHMAAAGLRRQQNIPCFSPRLRFRKMTKRGAVWFVEAMFPGYLFAQFVYIDQRRIAEHSPGVRSIVSFGEHIAVIEPETIAALRKTAGEDEIVTIDPEIKVGQSVQIIAGPLQGIEALVTQVLPAKERIRVLLEFLGRPVETEVSTPGVLSLERARANAGL